MLRSLQRTSLVHQGSRAFSTAPFLPRITERRLGEQGPGGRSSDAGVRVAIFGATGFLGKHLCNQIGRNGAFAYVGNRGDETEHRDIKPMFDLGHTRFVYYSPRDVDSMREVIADADVVVNLISKTYESHQPVGKSEFPYIGFQKNYSFQDVNVSIASQIAELCNEMQVDHLIHVSAANASPDHPSEWARTKYDGEQAVRAIYPWATIIRPTQFFGTEDKFLHFYANMASTYGFCPLIEDGQALTQPVWAVDVAKTISRIIDDPRKFDGRTVDCFGPSDYTHDELARFVLDITEQTAKPIVNVPKSVFMGMAKLMNKQEMILMNPNIAEVWANDFLPAMTPEEYKEQPEEGKILTMEDVGITPTPIEKEAFSYLHRFREGGHFGRVQGYH